MCVKFKRVRAQNTCNKWWNFTRSNVFQNISADLSFWRNANWFTNRFTKPAQPAQPAQPVQVHAFFLIRTSNFCQGSLFIIFWLFQPQFVLNLFLFLWAVWNDKKSKQKDKALKNNTDCLYFEEISVHLSKITDHCVFCPLSQFCCCQTILQDSFHLKTFLVFFSLSLILFLNCS